MTSQSCAGTIGETYVMPENMELGIINHNIDENGRILLKHLI